MRPSARLSAYRISAASAKIAADLAYPNPFSIRIASMWSRRIHPTKKIPPAFLIMRKSAL